MVACFKQTLNALTELEDYPSANGQAARRLRDGVGIGWRCRWVRGWRRITPPGQAEKITDVAQGVPKRAAGIRGLGAVGHFRVVLPHLLSPFRVERSGDPRGK